MAQEEKESEAKRRQLRNELEWINASPRARQAKGKARINAYDALVAEAAEREKRAGPAQITIPAGQRLGDVVVEADHLSKAFGDKLLIDDLSFGLPPGGIVGVIGANGAGKTTLFRMMTGAEQADQGSLRIGDTVDIGYVDQSRDALAGDKSVWQEISEGRHHRARQARGEQPRLRFLVQLQGL